MDCIYNKLDNIIIIDIDKREDTSLNINLLKIKNKQYHRYEKQDLLSFLENIDLVFANKVSFSEFKKLTKLSDINNKILYLDEITMIIFPYYKTYELKNIFEILIKNEYMNKPYDSCMKMIMILNILMYEANLTSLNSIEPLYFKIENICISLGVEPLSWIIHIKDVDIDLNDLDYYKINKDKKVNVNKKVFDYTSSYEELLKHEDIWASKEGFIYEFRQGQYELSKNIRYVINNIEDSGNIGCIEAPTGIGKSVGYLLPSIMESYLKSKKIIISTDTKELQTQLIHKDIPNILTSLGLTNKVSYGYIKGKSNYICKDRLESYINEYKDELNHLDDALGIIYIQSLIEDGIYGDMEEISSDVFETFIKLSNHLQRVMCDPNMCRPKKCYHNCLYKNRVEELKEEQITIVNHSLLAKWPYKEEKPLEHIIVDEAHNLVEKGYDFFSSTVESRMFKLILKDIYPYENISTFKYLYNTSKRYNKIKIIDKFYNHIHLERQNKDKISRYINFIYEEIENILFYGSNSDYNNISNYSLRWEINLQENSVAGSKIINNKEVKLTYKEYSEYLKSSIDKIIANISKILLIIEKYTDEDSIDKEADIYLVGKSKFNDLQDTKDILIKFLEDAEDDNARIIEIYKGFSDFEIKVVPLKLSYLFEENILNNVKSATFLSATLTVDNNMKYFKDTLGINKVKSLDNIISPIYDYQNRVKIYTFNDTSSYKNNEFIHNISNVITNTSMYLNGKLLSLYNSRERQLKVYDLVCSKLQSEGIEVYTDKKLLTKFKNIDKKSIMLGSKGFFEGVDVPGDALVCVTMDKLPNINPNDPLYYSIMQKYNRSYQSINYPQMIIKMKQSMGRLLRSKYDYGIFIIFDIGNYRYKINHLRRDLHGCDIKQSTIKNFIYNINNDLTNLRKDVFKVLIYDLKKSIHAISNTKKIDIESYINKEIKLRKLNAYVYKDSNDIENLYIKYFNFIYKFNLKK